MQKTLRTYLRPEARCSLKAQEKVCAAYNGKVSQYVEDERKPTDPFVTRESWLNHMRPGDEFAVPFFHRLATVRDDEKLGGLTQVRERIRKSGAVVIELATGRRTDNPHDYADMTAEAIAFYSQKGMTKAWAAKIGKLGAAASPVTKSVDGRAPHDQARGILNDHDEYPTLDDALAAINILKDENGKFYKHPWNAAFVYAEVSRGYLVLKKRKPGPRPTT
jgi:hypothetical protein